MISLKEQIISFVFSSLYGFISFVLYSKFYKYFYYCKKHINILNSLLFLVNLTLIYFKIFYYINDGYISVYFIIITVFVFLYLCNRKFNG